MCSSEPAVPPLRPQLGIVLYKLDRETRGESAGLPSQASCNTCSLLPTGPCHALLSTYFDVRSVAASFYEPRPLQYATPVNRSFRDAHHFGDLIFSEPPKRRSSTIRACRGSNSASLSTRDPATARPTASRPLPGRPPLPKSPYFRSRVSRPDGARHNSPESGASDSRRSQKNCARVWVGVPVWSTRRK